MFYSAIFVNKWANKTRILIIKERYFASIQAATGKEIFLSRYIAMFFLW